MLVYVDNIIVTGSDTTAMTHFITQLGVLFSLKSLGNLSYFVSGKVQPTAKGLFLSQQKYIIDLLTRASMLDAKPFITPMDANATLILTSSTSLDKATTYCTLVGSLQYLGLTRPDVAFAINKLSQYMHDPTTTYWEALKCLLRYLSGTLTYGLNLYAYSSHTLHASFRSHWAGDKDNFVSTEAYIVYLSRNLVSWSSKKQRSVARFSTEAEYRSIPKTATELIWLGNVL